MPKRHIQEWNERGEWVDLSPEDEAAAYAEMGLSEMELEFIRAQEDGEIYGDVVELDESGREITPQRNALDA